MKKTITKLGYAIDLNTIDADEVEKLKKQLTVKPIVAPDYDFGDDTEFSVYRTSQTRLYMPRYFGIKKFGPTEYKVNEGEDINVNFSTNLRPNQTEFCEKIMDQLKTNNSCIACSATGSGKCEAYDTPHIMYDGSIKMVQDLKVGDYLMGDDSTPRKVLSVCTGEDTMYEVIPIRGNSYTFNSDHILCLKSYCYAIHENSAGKWIATWFDKTSMEIKNKSFADEDLAKKHIEEISEESKFCCVSIKDYLKIPASVKNTLNLYKVGVNFPERKLPIEPYLVGLCIGNELTKDGLIWLKHSRLTTFLARRLPKVRCYLEYTGDGYIYTISGKGRDDFFSTLESLGAANGRIPDLYKINSKELRMQLLAGILDMVSIGRLGYEIPYQFCINNRELCDDIMFLVRSVGLSAHTEEQSKKYINNCDPQVSSAERKYREPVGIFICGNINQIPCKSRYVIKNSEYNALMCAFVVKEKPRDRYYGFTLDGNHKYLLGDFTVSHNTAMALWVVGEIKKRTLILVHKEFLKNQWIERIQQFLPTATIGTVQQDKCELDKDIIIGMIQTIVSRQYAPGTFDSISLLICDEMHHLGSKIFSQVFYKLGPRYTLGLSATPKRQDGLTKVIEWFLGQIVTNKVSSDVEIPTVKFVNAEYTSEITPKFNFKGRLNAANMVNQLVADEGRNVVIIREIDSVHKQGRKTLVLSGRKQHCIYLRDLLKDYDIEASLYLGGMSNDKLVESSKAKVILATYQMVSEAYDNPDLDTVIFATGMSNVEQAVGRILRKKNHFFPLVIDIIDTEYFGGQMRRRMAFYKKKKYIILENEEIQHSSGKYNDNSEEEEEEEPKVCLFK